MDAMAELVCINNMLGSILKFSENRKYLMKSIREL